MDPTNTFGVFTQNFLVVSFLFGYGYKHIFSVFIQSILSIYDQSMSYIKFSLLISV